MRSADVERASFRSAGMAENATKLACSASIIHCEIYRSVLTAHCVEKVES
jgi:hypothetical protein